jgi:hypothetical protein
MLVARVHVFVSCLLARDAEAQGLAAIEALLAAGKATVAAPAPAKPIAGSQRRSR